MLRRTRPGGEHTCRQVAFEQLRGTKSTCLRASPCGLLQAHTCTLSNSLMTTSYTSGILRDTQPCTKHQKIGKKKTEKDGRKQSHLCQQTHAKPLLTTHYKHVKTHLALAKGLWYTANPQGCRQTRMGLNPAVHSPNTRILPLTLRL